MFDAIGIQEFLDYVKSGEIPPCPPVGTSFQGYGRMSAYDDVMSGMRARNTLNNRGMWPIVDLVWTQHLAEWIGRRTVLEIMAGHGWLAKALGHHGINVTATDNYSWMDDCRHEIVDLGVSVKRVEAKEATLTIAADILLVSWPPYQEGDIIDACDAWGTQKPIVYIGEDEGGCNATDEFFVRFRPIEHPHIPLMSWWGIHDRVQIGYWSQHASC